MQGGLPFATKGQTIGLLGGSFDPPHAGHVAISKEALTRFRLDQLWWLVSPGNPLKNSPSQDFEHRFEASRKLLDHPRMHVCDYEMRRGTRYTAETLRNIMGERPDLRFVWLMGADNLGQFHKWNEWRWIVENVPIGVLARPGERLSARMSPVARIYRENRLSAKDAGLLAQFQPPVWCFVNIPMKDISSTELRLRGAGQSEG